MKTSFVGTLAMLSLSAALSPIHLWAQGPINVTVPFDFTVGSKTLAAGDYRVTQAAAQVLALQSIDGRYAMLVSTHPAEPSRLRNRAMLIFHRYGDRYFLSQVGGEQRGWGLEISAVEKELVAKARSSGSVALVASRGN